MSRAFLILFISTFLSGCSKDDSPISVINDLDPENGVKTTYTINGDQREYILYKPSNLPTNAPLVFVLHGYTQTAERFYNIGFNQIADTAKFVLCFPQGLNNAWNIYEHNSSDIRFLKMLAKDLQAKHSLNTGKTFATGFSMGAAMCNILALDATETFKAVAPVAGFVFQSIWSVKNPEYAIPYFTIHGTADQTVPITGFFGSNPSTQNIVDYWQTQNNCTAPETVQVTANTAAYYYRNGTNGNEVWFYKIIGQSHVFPGDPLARAGSDISGFNACQEIWRFFRKW